MLMIPASGPSRGFRIQVSSIRTADGPILCRVIEAFEDKRLGVSTIVFHQRDKNDGSRLGSLLLTHSGGEMVLERPGGGHCRATVFRLKSCFGRGLAMVPASKLKLGEHDEFTLRLPQEN